MAVNHVVRGFGIDQRCFGRMPRLRKRRLTEFADMRCFDRCLTRPGSGITIKANATDRAACAPIKETLMKRYLLALLVLGMFVTALVGCHAEDQKPSSGSSISLAR